MPVSGRVTIGIPTFNRSELALRSVESALAQTYADVEVVVSDDVSGDGTFERLQEIRDRRLRLFRQPERLGLVRNFDFCLRRATGEYFLLLGDDDMLLPTAIARLAEPFVRPPAALAGRGSVGMVWCPCVIARADGAPLWTTSGGPRVESPASMLLKLWTGKRGPRLSSILFRTADGIAVGGFRERHGDLCDLGIWATAALRNDWVVAVDKALVRYTNHHGSVTSRSSLEEWLRFMNVVHGELVAAAREAGKTEDAKKLEAARLDLAGSIMLTVLMQTIGKEAWIRNAWRELWRSPELYFRPHIALRLARDGWKVARAWLGCAPRTKAARTAGEGQPMVSINSI